MQNFVFNLRRRHRFRKDGTDLQLRQVDELQLAGQPRRAPLCNACGGNRGLQSLRVELKIGALGSLPNPHDHAS